MNSGLNYKNKIAKYENKFIVCQNSQKYNFYKGKIKYYENIHRSQKQHGGNNNTVTSQDITFHDSELSLMKNNIEKTIESYDKNLTNILKELSNIKIKHEENVKEINDAKTVLASISSAIPSKKQINSMIGKLRQIDRNIRNIDITEIIEQVNFVTSMLDLPKSISSTNINFQYFIPNSFITTKIYDKLKEILENMTDKLSLSTNNEKVLHFLITSIKSKSGMYNFNNYNLIADVLGNLFKDTDANLSKKLTAIDSLLTAGDTNVNMIVMYIFIINKELFETFIKEKTSAGYPATKKIYNTLISKFLSVPFSKSKNDFALWN